MAPADLVVSRREGERTRLLWVIDSLNMGGAESLVIPFVRKHDRDRYDLHVCCLTSINGNPMEAEVRAQGVRVTNLEARSLRDTRAFRRLVGLIRTQTIDLIHAHLTYAAIWGAVASRVTGVPSVASLHVAPPARGSAAARDWIMRHALQRWSERAIAVSDDLRGMYLSKSGLSASKTEVVHNGIDVERFAGDPQESRALITREFGIPAGARVLVAVSVLRPGKGIEVLLEAVRPVLASAPDVWLLILGDGPMADEWKALAGGIEGGERIRWGGFRRDVDAILPGCDVLVHPTLADAFPTVLLEAMAAGLPVIASRIGGVPEIVVEGVTGRLVPAGDAPMLTAAIDDVLDDPTAAVRMGREAREIARERFSTDAWITRLSRLYAAVLRAEEAET